MQKYSYTRSVREEEVKRILTRIEKFELNHKNITFLVAGFIVAYIILTNSEIAGLLHGLGSFGYLGTFLVGMLFSYGFTTATAAATLYVLAENLNPFWIALIAATGAVISDLIIFKFVRDRLVDEIKFILSEELHLELEHISRIVENRIFHRIIPAIAGLIMAMPIPGEFAAIFLGAVKYDAKKVAALSFGFNFIGIFFIGILANL